MKADEPHILDSVRLGMGDRENDPFANADPGIEANLHRVADPFANFGDRCVMRRRVERDHAAWPDSTGSERQRRDMAFTDCPQAENKPQRAFCHTALVRLGNNARVE